MPCTLICCLLNQRTLNKETRVALALPRQLVNLAVATFSIKREIISGGRNPITAAPGCPIYFDGISSWPKLQLPPPPD
jgi:hypothetical protein